MEAILTLSEYLTQKHSFRYLLSGKLLSDQIEARFGMYRQASGGNFFMSVKKLLSAEKKILCLSLLQQRSLLEASQIKESGIFSNKQTTSQMEEDYQWLIDFLSLTSIDDLAENDAAITFFVSGYIGRAISRRRKCWKCKDFLVVQNNCLHIQACIPDHHKELFELANRGGLSQPTEFCFAVTALAVLYYTSITAEKDIIQRLMCCRSQRSVFLNAVRKIVMTSTDHSSLLNAECDSGHLNFNLIIQTAFNCFAKNELNRLNSKPIAEEPPAKKLRKIRKLTSKGSEKQ